MLPHLCPVLADDGEEAFRVRLALYEAGIQTEEPYSVSWDAPNARELARRLVLVPCNASLGEKQIDRIVSVLEREFSRRGAGAQRRRGAA
jgi:dTDP-4-amino-4,6-dideoxygalactose transaminase